MVRDHFNISTKQIFLRFLEMIAGDHKAVMLLLSAAKELSDVLICTCYLCHLCSVNLSVSPGSSVLSAVHFCLLGSDYVISA